MVNARSAVWAHLRPLVLPAKDGRSNKHLVLDASGSCSVRSARYFAILQDRVADIFLLTCRWTDDPSIQEQNKLVREH